MKSDLDILARLELAEQLARSARSVAGAIVATPASNFVFDPTAPTSSGNIYNNLATLAAASFKVPGQKFISIVNNVTFPAGNYAFSTQADTWVTGVGATTGAGGLSTITIPNGVTLSGIRVYQGVNINFAGTAPCQVVSAQTQDIDLFDVQITTTGGAAFIRATGTGGTGLGVNLNGQTTLLGGTCIDSSGVGAGASVVAYGLSTILANTLAQTGGASTQIIIGSPNANVSLTHAGGATLSASSSFFPNGDAVASTSAGGALTGDLFVPGVPGRVYTPRSATVDVNWDATGVADAATRLVTFTLSSTAGVLVGGISRASPGGDAAFNVFCAGNGRLTGLTPGVAITLRVQWSASAGTYTPSANGRLCIRDEH